MFEDLEISIIAAYAIDKQGKMVIGSCGKLPWNIPQELEHFKNTTVGNACIFGRKTFDSIGKTLPKRLNIVLSSQKLQKADILVENSLKDAIFCAKKLGYKKIFICGGSSIYKQAIEQNLCTRLILSEIKNENFVYSGDTFFPQIPKNWKLISTEQKEEFCIKLFAKI